MKVFATLLVSAFALSSAVGQTNKTSGPPPYLDLTEVGRQHHPIRTTSWEAQAFFDQGLTLIYGFNHEEAARAFDKAAQLDPKSPMPLWGIAMAVGPNYNLDVDAEREKLAFETIQKAVKLSENSPANEKDYVTALAARYSGAGNPDYKKLARDYSEQMRLLAQKYPDDLDAATIYAESLMTLNPWKLWGGDGTPWERTPEIVRVLESVLARDPSHAGANHYYIHAVEASSSPERALPSAQRLETMVPKAGHLVHMPAHIYSRVGNFTSAVESNQKAIVADVAYAKAAEQSASMYDLMYHSHNEHFLAFAACMEGRYAVAKAAAEDMEKRLLPHAQMMPALDAFLSTPTWVDLRFTKWDAILTRPEPAKERAISHLMWRFSRAVAFAAHKDTKKAEEEQARFLKEADALPSEAGFAEQNPASAVLPVAKGVLAARVEAAKGNQESAIRHWRQAVEAQDKLNYDEPPDWYYPVRESLGAALLATGNAKEAEAVFREDLRRNPRNPRSLFGLKAALTVRHAETDADWVDRQFKSAWKNADTELKLADF